MLDSPQALAALSIVIPAFNEEQGIIHLLQKLQIYRQAGATLLLVDGGSTDNTVGLSLSMVDQVLYSEKGRATQLNTGAKAANSEYLWFIHADTIPADTVFTCMIKIVMQQDVFWGRFDVLIDGNSFWFSIIASMMNWRSCITGVATGDQGLLIHRTLFSQVAGFPNIALMEDVAISKKLKRIKRPRCFREKLHTSGRRWQDKGIFKTIGLMWLLRLAYFLGVSPDRLSGWYR